MNPQVYFETDHFEMSEEDAASDGRFGKALAEWFAQELAKRGVSVEGVVAEDFGWVVITSRSPFLVWLACGNVDDEKQQWSVFPVVEVPFYARLFKRSEISETLEKLWSQVKPLVPLIPGVRNIEWEE